MFSDEDYDILDGPEEDDVDPKPSGDYANPLYLAPAVAPTPRAGPDAYRSINPVWSPTLDHSQYQTATQEPPLARGPTSQPAAQQRTGLALEEDETGFSEVLQSFQDGQADGTQTILDYEAVCLTHAAQHREDAAQQQQQRGLRSIRLQDRAMDLDAEAATWKLLGILYGNLAPEPTGDVPLPGCGTVQTLQQQIAAKIKDDNELLRVWRVVTWLEALASEALDREEIAALRLGGSSAGFSEREGLPHDTAAALNQASNHQSAGVVSRIDPDATIREKRAWASGDVKNEQRITERLWRLVRAGRLAEACDTCRQCGQSWRAASLGGPPGPGLTPSGVAEWDEDNALPRGSEALAAEVDLGGQAMRASWRWACFQASEQIGGTAPHEAAVYGIMGGNLKRVLPLCTSWHDRCWALARSWLEARLDQLMEPNDSRIDISTEAVAEATAGGPASRATVMDGLSIFNGAWPTQSMAEGIPRSWEDVRAGAGMQDVYVAIGQDLRSQQQLVQWLLIVGPEDGHYSRLLMDLLPSCLQALQEPSNGDLQQYQKMLRFAAHLSLSLVHLELLPAPHDMDASYEYKPLQMKVNELVHAYLEHLLVTQQYGLVPALALPLRADIRREFYGCMLQQLILEGDLLACTQAYELAAAWFSAWSSSSKGDVEDRELDIIIEQVAEKSRWALEGGPLLRARTAQWLWLGPTTLAFAVRHTNALLREFALGGPGSLEAALVLLHSLPPEIQEMLQGPTQGLGDSAWVSPLVEAGSVRQEDVEETQLGLLQAHCFWIYFDLGRRFKDWKGKIAGPPAREVLQAVQEEGSQLLSTYLMFLSQQEDGIPPLLDFLSPLHQPAEEEQSLAVWVTPAVAVEQAEVASSSDAFVIPSLEDAAELAQRLQMSLSAAARQAGTAAFSLQAEGTASDGLEGCVKITAVAESTEALLQATAAVALACKAALPSLGEHQLPLLQVVNMEGDDFGQAHMCRVMCYPKAILDAAGIEAGEMQQLLALERQVVLTNSIDQSK